MNTTVGKATATVLGRIMNITIPFQACTSQSKLTSASFINYRWLIPSCNGDLDSYSKSNIFLQEYKTSYIDSHGYLFYRFQLQKAAVCLRFYINLDDLKAGNRSNNSTPVVDSSPHILTFKVIDIGRKKLGVLC